MKHANISTKLYKYNICHICRVLLTGLPVAIGRMFRHSILVSKSSSLATSWVWNGLFIILRHSKWKLAEVMQSRKVTSDVWLPGTLLRSQSSQTWKAFFLLCGIVLESCVSGNSHFLHHGTALKPWVSSLYLSSNLCLTENSRQPHQSIFEVMGLWLPQTKACTLDLFQVPCASKS